MNEGTTFQTQAFKTRTIFNKTPASGKENEWVIGLDVGYSAVKGMSANAVFCFPSYVAKAQPDASMKAAESTDIRYRDSTGTYVVGDLASYRIADANIMDSESDMTGRNWYLSQRFRISMAVGLAMGMDVNSFGSPVNKKLIVQTGLPPKVRKADTADLKEAMAGEYDFEMKLGRNDWKRYQFTIEEKNIYVTDQPLGALVSASCDRKGRSVPAAKNYFSSNVLVFDPGFVTLDLYTVVRGEITGSETFENLGMHEIFKRTCDDIAEIYGKHMEVAALLPNLETGTIKIKDKKDKMKQSIVDFKDLLQKNCLGVCEDALEKLKLITNYFEKTDYIIAAGGTYEAWKGYFNSVFENMEGLKIVPANINEPELSNIFSNVRGYYYYRLNS